MCSDHDQWRIHAYEAGASASAGTSQHGVTQLWGGVRPPNPKLQREGEQVGGSSMA